MRGDDDFVFYSQPASADWRVFHAGKSAEPAGVTTDRVAVDLVGFDDAVGTVAFAVSLDAPPGRSLADLGPVRATATGPAPNRLRRRPAVSPGPLRGRR